MRIKSASDREQVDLPGVVAVRADFPAHCCFLPREQQVNAEGTGRFPEGSNADPRLKCAAGQSSGAR